MTKINFVAEVTFNVSIYILLIYKWFKMGALWITIDYRLLHNYKTCLIIAKSLLKQCLDHFYVNTFTFAISLMELAVWYFISFQFLHFWYFCTVDLYLRIVSFLGISVKTPSSYFAFRVSTLSSIFIFTQISGSVYK